MKKQEYMYIPIVNYTIFIFVQKWANYYTKR